MSQNQNLGQCRGKRIKGFGGFWFLRKDFSSEFFKEKYLLIIHANDGQVFISKPKHSNIAFNI